MQKKTYIFLLLSFFVAYYVSISFFSHSHSVNGSIIVHSHPYADAKSNNSKQHQHSEEAYLLIHLLSYFIGAILFVYGSIKSFLFLKIFNFSFYTKHLLIKSFYCNNLLRAPPTRIHI